MLALDPRDPSVFTESVSPETNIQTGYDLLDGASDPRIITPQMTFGPYVGNLAQLSEKLVLVRGMSMGLCRPQLSNQACLDGSCALW